MVYYTYFLRCADQSLYAGIAGDLTRRMGDHFSQNPKCAKYTRSHPPKYLCVAWASSDRADASRLEYRLKQLTKDKKELLAAGGALEKVFAEDFCALYRPLTDGELAEIRRGYE